MGSVTRLGSPPSGTGATACWRATPDGAVPDGAVLTDGASAWFDCSVDQHIRAGDHDIVLLRVHSPGTGGAVAPQVFHAGRFRRLEPAAPVPNQDQRSGRAERTKESAPCAIPGRRAAAFALPVDGSARRRRLSGLIRTGCGAASKGVRPTCRGGRRDGPGRYGRP
ncbi:flavin reductase family protein [Peterkaempfera sp. SMS 1(5)a]|uniref:flavin reductase family protein n=1 Tax=Peterkaempfera podocarpi TaxID=3232308 RepID=UPI00366C136F